MAPIGVGAQAPPIPGADVGNGVKAVVFYKVTCPTCQMTAPPVNRLHTEFPDQFVAVVQDPKERAEEFGREFAASFPSIPDTEPYTVSNAYEIRTVPTVILVEKGEVTDVVESWDREGWNRVGARMGELAGVGARTVSEEGDGLPPFRPG
ncbi:MAG: peroxiredoxin family protein [Actinomycetota bacterium]